MREEIQKDTRAYAIERDKQDPLHSYRDQFHFPTQSTGEPYIYLCGNSLGLQPKSTESAIHQELKDWKNLGVEGHFHGNIPWINYHESLSENMAKIVGCKPEEVIVMNTLTVNLHLMMVSFYRPDSKRNKILIEADAFPSDKYAIESQIRFHGLDPKKCVIELKAREEEICLRMEDIQSVIEKNGEEISLIILGNTNYYTGQLFDMKKITDWGHAHGCKVGFDCAHGAGNVPLELHESGCDFAVWCNYKYLNSGPGSLGGVFVHERHLKNRSLPRFEGWWGHNKSTRFNMRGDFDPIPTADAWQLSNPPILSMVPIRTSLELFNEIGIYALREKAISLTAYAETLIHSLGEDRVDIITPSNANQRGSQLSIRVKNAGKDIFTKISEDGVIVDWREPNVIRVAPAPMYNSYEDVYNFYRILKNAILG